MSKKIVCDLVQIFSKSVSAVSPKELIRKSISYDVQEEILKINHDTYNLKDKKLFIVGTGKAVQHMARETELIFGSKIAAGIMSIPSGSLQNEPSSKIVYLEGAQNNLPDKNAQNTALKIKQLVESLDESCFLIVLISGGGSALLPLPKEPLTLNYKLDLIKMLAHAGADIQELNTVRKKLSDLKGGRLAILAQPAQVVSLILSDIVGDPLDLIASGPTVCNTDYSLKAMQVFSNYGLNCNLKPEALKLLTESGSNEKKFPSKNVNNYIIGNNKLALEEASTAGKNIGYKTIILSSIITGNIADVARDYLSLIKVVCQLYLTKMTETQAVKILESLQNLPMEENVIRHVANSASFLQTRSICFIAGGETTVSVKGKGMGGRSQQLALEFSSQLDDCIDQDDLDPFDVFILCAGTDGIDGPTDAAGAIGFKTLTKQAREQNIDPDIYLTNNDSYNFFSRFNDGEYHIKTGHTFTNVMDVHLMTITLK